MSSTSKSQALRRSMSVVAILSALCGSPFEASAQTWVERFNGAGSYWDEAHDMALSKGCVYVTGFSYSNSIDSSFATVKYSYSGKQEWVRYYGLDGPNSAASAEAVAADRDGNVFVTGRSAETVNSVQYVDAVTLKYDSAGNLLWERRHRSPGGNNQPRDIVIDALGNVYVAGASWVSSGFDLMLLKYSASGKLLWAQTIGEGGSTWDAGYAMALDAAGNPVVAGYSGTGNISYGYVVKFSSGGQVLWERRRISYSNASAWWRIAINAEGRIYVMGEIAPPGDLHHIWTSQYDASGNLVWDRDYDGTASGANYRGGMALTPTGGVVVCGISDDFYGYGVTNIVTLRYEADGTEVWRRLERGGYEQAGGRDVAVDTQGNAYVTGFGFNQNENMDYVTLKYLPDGRLDWGRAYAGKSGFTDIPIRIVVDSAQNVFVTGDSHGGLQNYFDFATIRYGP